MLLGIAEESLSLVCQDVRKNKRNEFLTEVGHKKWQLIVIIVCYTTLAENVARCGWGISGRGLAGSYTKQECNSTKNGLPKMAKEEVCLQK